MKDFARLHELDLLSICSRTSNLPLIGHDKLHIDLELPIRAAATTANGIAREDCLKSRDD